MEPTIFTSIPIGDMETLIINCFTACLKQHFKAEPAIITSQPKKEPLTVQRAADFLSLSVPTIYGLIHKGEIPYMKKGKRCYFLESDLMEYLEQGRRKSNAEIKKDVDLAFTKLNKAK